MNIYADAKNGNDSRGGTLEQPVQTLQKAQALARKAAAECAEDITVYLMPGTYTLAEPLVFDGAKDNSRFGKTVRYKRCGDGAAAISGAYGLGGWAQAGNGVVKAPVPPGFKTRDLYVNGRPAVRARTPVLKGKGLTWAGIDSPVISYRDGGRLADAANPGDVEVVFNYWWRVSRVGVATIARNGDDSVLTLKPVDYEMLRQTDVGSNDDIEDNAYGANKIWWLENSMAFLSEPGEFYYDKSAHTIYYKLREGEDAASLCAAAGMLEQLIVNTGDTRLKNITFDGLTFCGTTWLLPDNGGHCTLQAGFYHPHGSTKEHKRDKRNLLRTLAAVQMTGTDGVNFVNNDFINLGNGAIDLEKTWNTTIKGNLFTDCGGSAVVLGSWDTGMYQHTDDIEIITEKCDISDNYIHHICTNNLSACGIAVGYARYIRIDHNTIHDLPYTGISCGWGWGLLEADHESMSVGGSISYNEIYAVMQVAMDGGGIYTLSSRRGVVIQGNFVHDITRPFASIYLDNSSEGYKISGNVLRTHTGEKAAHLLLTCYSTTVENNFMDDTAGVYYIGFKDAAGNPVNTIPEGNGVVYWLTREEWELRNNTITEADMADVDAQERIIAQSGVHGEYRERVHLPARYYSATEQ